MKQCDLCSKIATWTDDEYRYCDKHKPLEEGKINKTPIYKRPNIINSDVAFLIHISDILDRAVATKPYAERLKSIARKLQDDADLPQTLSKNLRKHSNDFSPNKSGKSIILHEIRESEYTRYNAVGRITEICQKMNVSLPNFTFTSSGLGHRLLHTCTINVELQNEKYSFSAQARTKKEAKHAAAIKALESYLVTQTMIG
jgi:hypothetical protein